MTARKALIVYATKYGQTEQIAHFISERLAEKRIPSDLYDVKSVPKDLNFNSYSMVMMGTPIYASHHSSDLKKWVTRNLHDLRHLQSGFFTVSLNAADHRESSRLADVQLLHSFWNDLNWEPDVLSSFAGALHYKDYNFILRWMMKRISQAAGGPLDTHKNHILTDWMEVQKFADQMMECPVVKFYGSSSQRLEAR